MRRFFRFFALLVVVVAAAAAFAAWSIVHRALDHRVVLAGSTVVEIQPGESLRRVAAKLRQAGLVENERAFLFLAGWRGIDRRIKYGRHEFRGTVTLESVLAELGNAPKPILRVTIPEGYTLREIAALLENAGAVAAPSYVAVACSEEFRRVAGAPAAAACAEGFLFPDTYDLIPGMSPAEILALQLGRFRGVVEPLLTADPKPAASRTDLLTLASIVEKETAVPAERPRIASVFYNRLKAGMPLQTDPTVIYGVIDAGLPWDGNLTRAHLATPTPYNTYMKKGLPPAPICNPGRESIEAVLRPETTSDLYFVARGDGSHEFSSNLDAHNRAVRRYQLGRRTSQPAGRTGATPEMAPPATSAPNSANSAR